MIHHQSGTRKLPVLDGVGCFHGGRFFEGIGARFDHLERSREIINADVLDAWFPAAPPVLDALGEYLPWLTRTSPPTACDGFVEVVSEVRGVHRTNILPGAGSSDLIFRAFRHWLGPEARVLLLDPTYGEYAHVLEKVIGIRPDRLPLDSAWNFRVDLAELERASSRSYDLIALVNPNSPTGQHIGREDLERSLRKVPAGTRVWIDETYVEYTGHAQSMERFAAGTENVVVCKSMSKVYALSGLRAAYLCAAEEQLSALRGITPPWIMSLPAQVAGVLALQCPGYYSDCYAQTHLLREDLAGTLRGLGWQVVPGCANFLLAELPPSQPMAREFVERCRLEGLYLRDATGMGLTLGTRMVRFAVKDAVTNRRMADILTRVQEAGSAERAVQGETTRGLHGRDLPLASGFRG